MTSLFGNGTLPLLNSASPWATTRDDLTKLFHCRFTAAVTTRTTTLTGFNHDETIHQHCFFDPSTIIPYPAASHPKLDQAASSLNTLGYSPLPLETYLSYIESIVTASREFPIAPTTPAPKPFIVSVTGSAADVAKCALLISSCSHKLRNYPIHMEVNLSCPNIAGKPPPAYSREALIEYIEALGETTEAMVTAQVKFGIKTPPYTHAGQFQDIEDALLESTAGGKRRCPVEFITATNTLGACLVMTGSDGSVDPLLQSADGTGIGGMAGPSIHALSLGNVARMRQLLDRHAELRHIAIIGVGGVSDPLGFRRMQAAGAGAVAVATALGRGGVDVFERIASG